MAIKLYVLFIVFRKCYSCGLNHYNSNGGYEKNTFWVRLNFLSTKSRRTSNDSYNTCKILWWNARKSERKNRHKYFFEQKILHLNAYGNQLWFDKLIFFIHSSIMCLCLCICDHHSCDWRFIFFSARGIYQRVVYFIFFLFSILLRFVHFYSNSHYYCEMHFNYS